MNNHDSVSESETNCTLQAMQQGYCNGVSSSVTLERPVGQTPKQKYRPLSLGRSFDQDLFEEDLEREFKAKAIVTLREVRWAAAGTTATMVASGCSNHAVSGVWIGSG